MTRRYFVEVPITDDRATLAGPEAHHLAHVMRAKPGERVTLFDGSGCEFAASVEVVRRAEIELAIHACAEVDRELRASCTLAVALPKGDRQAWLVEKAVELGVTRLVPLQTARGVAQPVEKALDRLRRAVIEASKQCGRNRLMEISAPQSWNDYVQTAPASSLRMVAHPGQGLSLAQCLKKVTANGEVSAFDLAIGPEGGFADDEINLATQHGWTCVELGARILRVETAAALLAAFVALAIASRGENSADR
jgi:16S rRNA (uracil1498-N3)-methyltransferase